MIRRLLASVAADSVGAMAVEMTAVAPFLAILSLGGFEVSAMVSRQTELQVAASEASNIALASRPETAAERATVEDVIEASTGLADDQVALDQVFRCGSDSSFVTKAADCGSMVTSAYLQLDFTQTYTPTWTSFGIGAPLTYSVRRYVMLEQQS